MKRYIILVLLTLTGCNPTPLPTHMMLPGGAVYNQIEQDFYLKHKVEVGEFSSKLSNERTKILYQNASAAASQAFLKAGLLAPNNKSAKYSLSAYILDVQNPRCFWGTCEGGSAIEYTLTEKNGENVVYNETVIVPFNYDYPLFGDNTPLYILSTLSGSIGNNIAHEMHILTNKTKGDLK